MSVPARTPLSPLGFFAVWAGFGLQSFGGGSVVLTLMQRAAVEEYAWVTEAEFTRDWALVQTAPGINLLAHAVLLGRRVDGLRGVGLALGGLLLPSVTATLLLTALYRHIESLPAVRAALRGLLPATVGVGLMTAWKMVRPTLIESRREGPLSLGVSIGLLAGSAVAMALAGTRLPVAALLVMGGAIAALFRGWQFRRRRSVRENAA